MSQNAILDRTTAPETTNTGVAAEPVGEALSHALAQREHLILVDWNPTTGTQAPAIITRAYPPIRPVPRPWFGWSEAAAGLLLLASGVASVISLFHLQ